MHHITSPEPPARPSSVLRFEGTARIIYPRSRATFTSTSRSFAPHRPMRRRRAYRPAWIASPASRLTRGALTQKLLAERMEARKNRTPEQARYLAAQAPPCVHKLLTTRARAPRLKRMASRCAPDTSICTKVSARARCACTRACPVWEASAKPRHRRRTLARRAQENSASAACTNALLKKLYGGESPAAAGKSVVEG